LKSLSAHTATKVPGLFGVGIRKAPSSDLSIHIQGFLLLLCWKSWTQQLEKHANFHQFFIFSVNLLAQEQNCRATGSSPHDQLSHSRWSRALSGDRSCSVHSETAAGPDQPAASGQV